MKTIEDEKLVLGRVFSGRVIFVGVTPCFKRDEKGGLGTRLVDSTGRVEDPNVNCVDVTTKSE